MTMRILCGAVAVALATTSGALAQNPSSNKAFFAKNTDGVTFAPLNGTNGDSEVVTLISVAAALKTSNGGAVSATLSMETLLSTYNLTQAIVNGGKASSSSRAGIKAWIELDGKPMEPGVVWFNDRLQATALTVNLTCTTTFGTCDVTGDVILELFQDTKSANSFTFFLGPLPPTVHKVEVKAQGVVECRSGATVIPCPSQTIDGYLNAQTQAAIGKASLMIEEQQNWGSQ